MSYVTPESTIHCKGLQFIETLKLEKNKNLLE